MTIWHVDDDTLQLELTAAMLQKVVSDVSVESFENARQAAEKLQGETPDLILLDLNMPHISGWEFLESVKGMKMLPPIAIVTSSIDPRDKVRGQAYACVKAFLIKPLRLTDIADLFSSLP